MDVTSKPNIDSTPKTTDKVEANTYLGLGVGVGALGTAGAIVSGAVCPMCVFVVPALLAMGIHKHIKIAKNKKNI